MVSKKKILILFAHPAFHKSRINSKLIARIKGIEGITVHNLYEEYPNFHIDVKREQALILKFDIIVWHHPFYWYSAPAIIKEWIDLVLEHNFAYGKKGKALEGKQVLSAITAGGRREAYQKGGYNNFTIRQLLSPFEQTTNLCRMEYLPPYVIHGTHLIEKEKIQEYAENYKTILISLRDNIFSPEEIRQYEYLNDILETKEKK